MKPIYRHAGLALALLVAVYGSAAGVPPVKPPRAKFQEAVPKVDASFEPSTARRGETIQWRLAIELAPGWYTYAANQVDDAVKVQAARFTFPPPGDVVFVGELKEPAHKTKAVPEINIREVRYLDGSKLVWEQPVVVSPQAKPGPTTVKVVVRLIVCSAKTNICLSPQDLEFQVPLTISDAEPVPVDPKYEAALKAAGVGTVDPPSKPNGSDKPPPGSAAQTKEGEKADAGLPITAETTEQYRATLEQVLAVLIRQEEGEVGLLAFILAGIAWGAVSLVTPCVFPMIPITVSYFLKQSEKEHHRPVTMALVYCSTIIVVLTVGAMLLLSTFVSLSRSPLMNFGMGLLFVFFALSLFGWYEIELPSGLAQYTSAREGQGGLVGTMFMALTFTILSFACVAPFLGGFAALVPSTGNVGELIAGGDLRRLTLLFLKLLLGGLAFSATFAAPFFVLALFPNLLKKMPKSGSWLNSVKVVMGFLELAAAFKFLRLGELMMTSRPTLFTYDLVMGIWVALALLCGLYLIGVYRLPHDTPSEHIGVPRLVFSAIFIGLGFYLLPALFQGGEGEKQRPGGTVYAWVDSFLLPEPPEGKGALAWSGNLQAAIEEARTAQARQGRPKYVFIDFTGKS